MRRTTAFTLFAACLLLTFSACKDKVADLDGTTWKVVKMVRANGTSVIPQAVYTVHIADGQARLKLDVNQVVMSYEIKSDGKIHLGQGAMSMACCDKPEGEAIAASMEGAFDIDLASNGATLMLKGKDTIHLVPHTK